MQLSIIKKIILAIKPLERKIMLGIISSPIKKNNIIQLSIK
jgi:hypothetical protein